MAAVAERPAERQDAPDASERKIHLVRIWLMSEQDHWVAVAPEFDVATQASDESLALESLQEMLLDYLNACAGEGMSLEEARRPVPFSERIRFQIGWVVSQLLRWLHGRRRFRSGLFLPGPHGRTC